MSTTDSSFVFCAPGNPLGEGMQKFRLENKLTDVVLKVGNKKFPAHKNVLAVSSPVLETQLSEIWQNHSKEKFCVLNQEFVDPSIADDLLTFFYTAKVTLTNDNAYALCVASHFLNVPSLLGASEKFLSERISEANAMEMYFFAEKRQLSILMKSCLDFILNKFEPVFEAERFEGCGVDELKTMANCINEYSGPAEAHKIKAKEGMFGALIKWTEIDLPNRSARLPELLGALSLDDLSSKFLGDVVAGQALIRENHQCGILLNDALRKALQIRLEAALSKGFKEQMIYFAD